MGKFSIKFYDEKGRCSLGREELEFLLEKPSPKKIYCMLFALKRLIQNRAFYPFLLVLKGTLNSFIGRKFLSNEEYRLLFGALFLKAKKMEYSSNGCQMQMYFSSNSVITGILFSVFNEVVIKNQYCLTLENVKNKAVIDAGANVGIFSIYAANLGAKKIYAFEPVKGSYELLKKNISANKLEKIIVPVNKALGDANSKKRIKYLFDGDAGASFVLSQADFVLRQSPAKSQATTVTTLDEIMKNKGRVDFIKMDVEGYEAKALRGAKNIIKKYKPVLSFSAYHKPEDKKVLPALVRSIRPDYSCRLVKRAEELFYCK